jgi:hypothetical protein
MRGIDMKRVAVAHYDSRNFSFEAIGLTHDEAKEALLEGLKNHAAEYNTDEKHWWYDDDIWIEDRLIGFCYRDHDIILKKEAV